ncbi:MAG TPA: diguanylate cyclase [bacterium]|nr:diguanylate cyclase [bacterium]
MRAVERLQSVTKVFAVLFVGAVFAYAFVLMPLGFLETPQLKALDIFFRISHALRKAPAAVSSLAVVAIDDVSLQQVNRKWPWDRDVYEKMVRQLNAAQPRVIGFDIIFLGESANKENDEAFRRAIGESGNVVLASYYTDMWEKVLPNNLFAEAARSCGSINKPRDSDYRIRDSRFFVRPPKEQRLSVDFSFEVKVLCEYFGCDPRSAAYDGKYVRLQATHPDAREIVIPVSSNGIFTINYLAGVGDFTVIPAWQVINGRFNPDDVRGRIVLVGQTNEIIHDVYPTPLLDMPGVLINANALLTVLTGRYITMLPPLADSIIVLVFALLAVCISYAFKPLKGFFLIVLEIAVCLLMSAMMFYLDYAGDFFSGVLCIVAIYIAVIFYKYVNLVLESINLKQDAITDGLTGLYILRYFTTRVQNEFERAKRYNTKLSFIMMDIDLFKRFNDTYGHEQGNVVLKGFAAMMKDTFRKSDILARYGGEEFCALLPGVGRGEAFETAERFRRKLQSSPFTINGEQVAVTVSAGVVSLPDTYIEKFNDFVELSDKALYEAKHAGRNRTVYYSDKTGGKE